MTITYIKHPAYLLISLAILLFSACNEDDNYTPGTEIPASCEQVYFSKENAASLMLPIEGSRSATLIVARTKTSSALSMPINILSKDDKLTIPSTIEFTAGSPTTNLEITLSADANAGTEYIFELELTGDNIDPYTKLDGSAKFFGSVMIEKWNTLQATFSFEELYSPWEGEIENLEGSNKYQIKDFLKSGKTVEFTIDKSTGAISFSGGYNDGTYWQFLENDNFIPCYPTGSDTYITSTYIYLGASYSYLNLNKKSGRIYHWNNYSENSSNWNALNISWK